MASRGLKDEIKKRNPFDSAEQEAALNLARTHDRLQPSFTSEVGDRGSSRSPGSGERGPKAKGLSGDSVGSSRAPG